MHEVGVTERLLEVALQNAQAAGADRVVALHLELGRDGDVSPEALRFYWPLVSKDSLAAGARLHIRQVAGDGIRLRSIDVEPDGASMERPLEGPEPPVRLESPED